MAIAGGIIAAMARGRRRSGCWSCCVLARRRLASVLGVLRLSLALPMSFAQRRFRLYESWDLTRGQAGKMFLVGSP